MQKHKGTNSQPKIPFEFKDNSIEINSQKQPYNAYIRDIKELDHRQLRSMIPWVSAQPHTWPLFPLPAFLSYIPTPSTCQIHGITSLNQVDIEENIEFDRLPIHYQCVLQDWINQKLSSPNVASGRVAKTGAPAPSPVSPSTVGSLENIIRGPSPAR